ncbi:Protein ANTAGONIST OF LIKE HETEROCHROMATIN PROTEIN 1 [Frankliniella fusca]|uniref:Protein ANTAGONIST OF LIKE HETEROCHROMATIN PROTEIN 1 n=1 Tax=Frankliniella fusca TaxID=407009 RepID=A0AAE1HKY2_9NEOP|nr:Protein ANTAGONIST OF LIKE HETEROCHROMATIN PROTEIN 1 [Frankliniella fusca]
MDGNIAQRLLIAALEEALIEEERQHVMRVMIGRMAAKIMGNMEEGVDLDVNNEAAAWVRVEVDVRQYRLMGDPAFQFHFRLSKSTYEVRRIFFIRTDCYLLCTFMRNGVRIRNSIDIPLLMVLWILATPDSFRSVALRFGVLPADVHYHYRYLIEVFRLMAPTYIKWPDQAERNEIKRRFQNYSGFPGIVGVIDGTYNPVTAPSIQRDRFRTRHHNHAFNSMVVCVHNLLIRDMHIGEVGSMHDQRVFRRSQLYTKLMMDDNMQVLNIDEHIIGDSAYALMDREMVPFRNAGNLTAEQRRYNYALCRCRARMEHAFGKAFGQWRRMKMLHSANIELAVDQWCPASFFIIL